MFTLLTSNSFHNPNSRKSATAAQDASIIRSDEHPRKADNWRSSSSTSYNWRSPSSQAYKFPPVCHPASATHTKQNGKDTYSQAASTYRRWIHVCEGDALTHTMNKRKDFTLFVNLLHPKQRTIPRRCRRIDRRDSGSSHPIHLGLASPHCRSATDAHMTSVATVSCGTPPTRS